jgi:hypothetical protein
MRFIKRKSLETRQESGLGEVHRFTGSVPTNAPAVTDNRWRNANFTLPIQIGNIRWLPNKLKRWHLQR